MDYQKMLVITNRKLCQRPFLEQIERVVKLQPKGIVLREKDLDEQEYRELALAVKNICEIQKVPLIIHKWEEVAKELKSPFVHLPFSGLEASTSESFGVSVHSLEDALAAQSRGASYLIAGHVFQTDCKKGVPPRGIRFLKEICDNVKIPVYGIGGISEENYKDVLSAGATGFCMMSEMMRVGTAF